MKLSLQTVISRGCHGNLDGSQYGMMPCWRAFVAKPNRFEVTFSREANRNKWIRRCEECDKTEPRSVWKRGEVGRTPIPHVDGSNHRYLTSFISAAIKAFGRYVFTSHREINCRHRFLANFSDSFPLIC